ncbi:MAG: NUDIX domain-containing protein, partial [candidate division KSB1 bacterium]|nr:NUDIX domain-containing protein [candidate division KSB1 bacterium]
QQRACAKYHSGCLWTNACCSHPRPEEPVNTAAHRRLQEEMGFDTELQHAFHFIYKAELDHGLTEHEFDHVFIGHYDGVITPNSAEVDGFRWVDLLTLKKELAEQPDQFTIWFRIAIDRVLEYIGYQSKRSV